ncbi:hypothetical protein L843_2318 [Mycobacterium intracellulare MIN_061107_1834]|nr:hypothetical protein L843_2318 [Mycobacterium intracellulare MIN_061107_1834]
MRGMRLLSPSESDYLAGITTGGRVEFPRADHPAMSPIPGGRCRS